MSKKKEEKVNDNNDMISYTCRTYIPIYIYNLSMGIHHLRWFNSLLRVHMNPLCSTGYVAGEVYLS